MQGKQSIALLSSETLEQEVRQVFLKKRGFGTLNQLVL